jgi:hypothetical protein
MGGDRKCIQNFAGETSSKMFTKNAERRWEVKIEIYIRAIEVRIGGG